MTIGGIMDTNITEPRHAGFWIRAGAEIIDMIILSVLEFTIGLILGIARADNFSSPAYSYLLVSLYYTILIKMYGQTIGKKVLGIKVIRQDGKRITFWGAFCREIIWKYVGIFILGIGFLMVAIRKDKRALHDLAMKTIVVYCY
jgi:uncharacterized RDD family membrane protein YckC